MRVNLLAEVLYKKCDSNPWELAACCLKEVKEVEAHQKHTAKETQAYM